LIEAWRRVYSLTVIVYLTSCIIFSIQFFEMTHSIPFLRIEERCTRQVKTRNPKTPGINLHVLNIFFNAIICWLIFGNKPMSTSVNNLRNQNWLGKNKFQVLQFKIGCSSSRTWINYLCKILKFQFGNSKTWTWNYMLCYEQLFSCS
jgi:hypothetical protein